MLANLHYYTRVQTDVSQGLIALDRQAKCHVRTACSQLICVLLFLASTVGIFSVQPLASMRYTSVSVQEVLAAPAEQLFITLAVGTFSLSWLFWFWDLKYNSLASKYAKLYQQHTELIKTSAPLTELSAHYRHLMSLASHCIISSNVVVVAYVAGIIIYHLQP